MNATGATLVFSVSLAAVELAGAYGGSQVRGESSFHIGSALLALAVTLPPGAFAFWFGARRVRHKWYSALISGVVAFAFALATLGALKLVVSIWLQFLAIDAVIAASGFLLGRKPLFPEVANETRS
jgi:hypothetical protein